MMSRQSYGSDDGGEMCAWEKIGNLQGQDSFTQKFRDRITKKINNNRQSNDNDNDDNFNKIN